MPKSWMIADYLRPYAQWRIDRAEERDDGRNARAAIGLIDAAAYAMQLDDSDRVIVRLAIAGCFAFERFNPGTEGERLIRRWHYDDTTGAPRDLLVALADAAERGIGQDAAHPPSRPTTRWRNTDRDGARSVPAARDSEAVHSPGPVPLDPDAPHPADTADGAGAGRGASRSKGAGSADGGRAGRSADRARTKRPKGDKSRAARAADAVRADRAEEVAVKPPRPRRGESFPA
ncbi:hypothetical protein [Actinomadura gamaensis]|uniref:Uncharacterized protein n=1 Tax=Actinomadura gamaensis TaxID=1763541 RepID=A0ABV9UBK2_9ACTN